MRTCRLRQHSWIWRNWSLTSTWRRNCSRILMYPRRKVAIRFSRVISFLLWALQIEVGSRAISTSIGLLTRLALRLMIASLNLGRFRWTLATSLMISNSSPCLLRRACKLRLTNLRSNPLLIRNSSNMRLISLSTNNSNNTMTALWKSSKNFTRSLRIPRATTFMRFESTRTSKAQTRKLRHSLTASTQLRKRSQRKSSPTEIPTSSASQRTWLRLTISSRWDKSRRPNTFSTIIGSWSPRKP